MVNIDNIHMDLQSYTAQRQAYWVKLHILLVLFNTLSIKCRHTESEWNMTVLDDKVILTWKNAVPIYRDPKHWWTFSNSVSVELKQLDINKTNKSFSER